MPKQPTIRPTYKSDAKYFRRLAHAIERDLAKPQWWRDRAIAYVNLLVAQFEEADNVWEEKAPTQEET